MNLPNKLSLIRFLLMPVIAICFYIIPKTPIFGTNLNVLILTIIFIFGSITDFLDGYIARKDNLITDFGKFIDPLADKVLVLTMLVFMVEMGKIPAWTIAIILLREFAVSGYRLVKVNSKEKKVVPASIYGKLKTVSQMIAIIFLMLDNNSFCYFLNMNFSGNIFPYIFNLCGSLIYIFSLVMTIFSGLDYMKDFREVIVTK